MKKTILLYKNLLKIYNNLCEDGVEPFDKKNIKILTFYKPKSIDKLLELDGIDKDFINNYGDLFISEIISFTNRDVSEQKIDKVNTDVEIDDLSNNEIKKLKYLKNRLVDISSNNRLINIHDDDKNVIDLFKYFDLEFLNEIINLISQKKTFIDKKIIWKTKDDSIKDIIIKSNLLKEEFGIHNLFIAYPFYQNIEQKNNDINAPLSFIPIDLKFDNEGFWLSYSNKNQPIFNSLLIHKLMNITNNNPISSAYFNYIYNWHEENASFYSELLQYYKETSISDYFEKKLFENNSRFEPLKLNLEKTHTIKKSICLGIFNIYDGNVRYDFNNIIDNNELNDNLELILKDLNKSEFNKIEKHFLDSGEMSSIFKSDEFIPLISKVDFSQETILRKINKSDNFIIHSPKNNGIVNVVTNIIANSLTYGENILIVSEKPQDFKNIDLALKEINKYSLTISDLTLFEEELYEKMKNMYNIALNHEKKDILTKERRTFFDEREAVIYDFDRINKYFDKKYFGYKLYNLYQEKHNTKLAIAEKQKLKTYFDTSSLKEFCNNISIDTKYSSKFYNDLTDIETLMNEQVLYEILEEYFDYMNANKWVNFVDIDFYRNKNFGTIIKNINKTNYPKLLRVKVLLTNYIKPISKKMSNRVSFLRYFKGDGEQIEQKLLHFKNNFLYVHDIWNDFPTMQKNWYLLVKKYINDNRDLYLNKSNIIEINQYIFTLIIDFLIKKIESDNVSVIKLIENSENKYKKFIDYNNKFIDINRKTLYENQIYNFQKSLIKLNDENKQNLQKILNKEKVYPSKKFISRYFFQLMDGVKIWMVTPDIVSTIFPNTPNLFKNLIVLNANQLTIEKIIPSVFRAEKMVVFGDDNQLSSEYKEWLNPNNLYLNQYDDELELDFWNSIYDKCPADKLDFSYFTGQSLLLDFNNVYYYDGEITNISLYDLIENEPPFELYKLNSNSNNNINIDHTIEIVRKIIDLFILDNELKLGVITFTYEQAKYITKNLYDYIYENLVVNPLLKTLISKLKNNEIFIKNIENSQSNEADIIILDTTFGKNESTLFIKKLDFDQGLDLLNVATSRASKKLLIFNDIEIMDKDVKVKAVNYFTQYIEYVESVINKDENRIIEILNKKNSNHILEVEPEIEYPLHKEIFSYLQKNFSIVEKRFEISQDKIDFIVQNNNKKMAILLQGDKSEQNIRFKYVYNRTYLEQKGFIVFYLWINQWNEDKEKIIEEIRVKFNK